MTTEYVRYKFYAKGTTENCVRYSVTGVIVAKDGCPHDAFEKAADCVFKTMGHRPNVALGHVNLRKLKKRRND